MKPPTAWRLVSIIALTALLIFLTDVFAAKQSEAFKQLDLLVEIRHELVNSYVEEPDQLELIESAVHGMIASLEDPHTVFVPTENVDQFESRLTGSFSGIGAEIDMLDGRPRIVTPLEDSPAWEAGIMAGDIILAVDGVTTQGLSQSEVIDLIKGEAGTDVMLTVRRVSGEELDITITRARINVQTVRGARRQADQSFDFMIDHTNKIGYVRISQFTGKTVEELADALTQLKEQDVEGLILDVRFDPGGLLDAAVEICDLFLTEGQRIVSTKGRRTPEVVYDSTDETLMPDTPIVVLANEGSASASEVVTGALSDNERALFVGTRTFGKGSVQQVRELNSGMGALKITGAYYYLPSGRNIHRRPDAEVWGVDPDEGAYVPMSYDDYENMLTTRREADILRAGNGHDDLASITPEYIKDQLHDPQLAAALTALLGKLETGDWPTVGESNGDELVRQRERELLERRRSLLLEELAKVESELVEDKDDPVSDEQVSSDVEPEPADPTTTPDADVTDIVKTPSKEPVAEEPEAEVIEQAPEAPKPEAEVPDKEKKVTETVEPEADVEVEVKPEVETEAEASPEEAPEAPTEAEPEATPEATPEPVTQP